MIEIFLTTFFALRCGAYIHSRTHTSVIPKVTNQAFADMQIGITDGSLGAAS